MKKATCGLLIPLATAFGGDSATVAAVHAKMMDADGIFELLERAFPPVSKGGKWADRYYTKRYDGLDPSLGGFPTALDTEYPFEFPAPFLGQAGAGGPHHCPENHPNSRANECPKVTTQDDNGPYGPGHIPPHIALRSLRDTLRSGELDPSGWFDYSLYGCRIVPSKLLSIIRAFYPRDANGNVDYPSAKPRGRPETWEWEFPTPDNKNHYCTDEFNAAGGYDTYCPYHESGMYRHPHLAVASIEVYLSNYYMPDKCASYWDDSDYPKSPDSSYAWPVMEDDSFLAQPVFPVQFPDANGLKKKSVKGMFVNHLVVVDDNIC